MKTRTRSAALSAAAKEEVGKSAACATEEVGKSTACATVVQAPAMEEVGTSAACATVVQAPSTEEVGKSVECATVVQAPATEEVGKSAECATLVQAPAKGFDERDTAVEPPAVFPEDESAAHPSAADMSAEGDNIAAEALAEDNVRGVSVSTQESVIVISDDEDPDCTLGNSVLIIEEPYDKSLVEEKKSEELVLDEELAITFTRSGNVMPHARYDCMAYPFVRDEHETNSPLERNADVCDQCYCYLCDKPALQCPYWTTISICHCNAHNKSFFWKSRRDAALAGILTIFDLDLTEIDADLRHGGYLLLTFLHELTVEFNKYLMGMRVTRDLIYTCTCGCHQGQRTNSGGCHGCLHYHSEITVYSYVDVYKKLEEFLVKAENEKPKAAAVILLGLAKEIIFQKEPPQFHQLGDTLSSLRHATPILLGRILTTLQKMLVLSGFPNNLYDKFIRFFQALPLPPHCYSFSNCLNILPWDDLFLITILLGQNVTGQRTKKGKKEFLFEVFPVIQARVQKLEDEGNYKHLVRYLKAVRCSDLLALQHLREKIPFYMCKYGDFAEAAQSLIHLKCASCSMNINLSQAEFALYLKMFRTESCPSGNQLIDQEEWTSHKGIQMKRGLLVKLILRIIYINKTVFQSPQCWSALIHTWCCSPVLGPKGELQAVEYNEPNLAFQRSVMDIAFPILEMLKKQTHVNLPEPFCVMPNEAELILIVRAFADKMLFDPRPPALVLEVILAFEKNIWALRDLLEAITPRNDLVYQFTQKLADELCFQKQIALQRWSVHGSEYLCQLIYTFLRHLNMLVRSVGFHMIDILIENINTLPWSQQLAQFLQSKVSGSFIFFTPSERNELKKKIAVCQSKV